MRSSIGVRDMTWWSSCQDQDLISVMLTAFQRKWRLRPLREHQNPRNHFPERQCEWSFLTAASFSTCVAGRCRSEHQVTVSQGDCEFVVCGFLFLAV